MKLKDIFNIDLSTRGGVKLYRKIMGKYNIPKQDSKQLVKEIRNSSEGGGVKEYYYLFDADKCIEISGVSEEDFNAELTQNNGAIISLFFYGALNFIVEGTDYYYREYVITNQLSSINVFKKIKAIKLYDNINPMEITIDTEHYNIVGNLEDRYIKQKNIGGFDMPNPALYTTLITKEEYEALIDIPNIIV